MRLRARALVLFTAAAAVVACSGPDRQTRKAECHDDGMDAEPSAGPGEAGDPEQASPPGGVAPPMDAGTAGDAGAAPTPDMGAEPASDFDLESVGVGIRETSARYLAEAGGAASIAPSSAPAPALGESVYLADYCTTLRRVTGSPWGNHDYSQLQAFAHDNAHVLLIERPSAEGGGWVVRRWPSLDLAVDLGGTESWNVPRWHPREWNKIVHFDSNGDTVLRLQTTDVESGQVETLSTLPAEYQRIRNNQSFDEISRTGEWLAGLATTSGGQKIITFNIATRSLGAEIDFDGLYRGPCRPDPQWGNIEPDWIGVSPLGRYLVVQWPADGTARCQGLETFDIRTGAFVGRVNSAHPHGDLAVLADGATEAFVGVELAGPGPGRSFVGGVSGDGVDQNYPALAYRTLPGPSTGEQSPSFLYLTDWIVDHVSCRGPFGWCLVTALVNPGNQSRDPLEGEVFLIRLDGTGVVRLAQHRSSSADYWQQPRASFSNDGRYVIFDSDWRSGGSAGSPAVYVIDLAIPR